MNIELPCRLNHAGILVVLVCGGRAFIDSDWLLQEMLDIVEQFCYGARPQLKMVVLQGGASGADFIAREWALLNNVHLLTERIDWDFSSSAWLTEEPLRNQRMIDKHKPDLCIAAPGATADMMKRCMQAKIPVYTLDGAADDGR